MVCLPPDGRLLSLKPRLAGGGAPGGLPGAPVLSWAVLPAPGGVVPFLAGTTKEVKAAEKGPQEQGRASSFPVGFPSNLPVPHPSHSIGQKLVWRDTPLPSHWPEVSLRDTPLTSHWPVVLGNFLSWALCTC